jgi:hypothetical protein
MLSIAEAVVPKLPAAFTGCDPSVVPAGTVVTYVNDPAPVAVVDGPRDTASSESETTSFGMKFEPVTVND